MKIAYIGIDILYTAMEALLDAGCEILEVFTCKTDNKTEFNIRVTARAKELNVPCSMDRIREENLRRLADKGCEAVFIAGYYYRIPILEGMPMVNVHPAYLPLGRGAWPMPVTIMKGLPESGVTLHKLTRGLDMGDILMQESFRVSDRENLEGFMEKADTCIRHMIPKLLADFRFIYENAEPQGEGEYWACPVERDWTVSPDMTEEEIDRILRAFYGYECIWEEDGKKYELIKGRLIRQCPGEGSPGKGMYFCTRGGNFIVAEKIEEID